ncbi:hypothetical protein ACWEP4_28460 [Streptomyces sp. NPDC004227]
MFAASISAPHMYSGSGRFLKAGDTLVTEIEGLRRLTNPVVSRHVL